MSMISDIHRHFVPPAFLEFVTKRPEFAVRIKRAEGEEIDADIRGMHFGLNTTFFDLDLQLARMRREGVEGAVLSLATPFIDYHQDEVLAGEAACLFNDELAKAIAAQKGRLRGWAFLPMQGPERAAAELRRCVREYGFVGGHIASNVRGVYLDDPRFEPVWNAALELNVPLFVHPADPPGKDRTRDFELTVVAGYLFDTSVNILRMVCSGFLDRCPKLKFICAHAGAYSLALRARMQREVDTNSSLGKTLTAPVGEYLRRLYYDSICFEPSMLRYAAEVVTPERLFLGSDAPFPLGEPDPVNFVCRALPTEEAAGILSGNFERLLRA
jgi:aminocarboxymuconate-semialdehyde decarboxylase